MLDELGTNFQYYESRTFPLGEPFCPVDMDRRVSTALLQLVLVVGVVSCTAGARNLLIPHLLVW